MAENSTQQSNGDSGAGSGPTMDEIAAGLKLGQSKSTGDVFIGFSEVENPREGKNKMVLVCQHCKCRVIRPGYATLVEKEVGSGEGRLVGRTQCYAPINRMPHYYRISWNKCRVPSQLTPGLY